MWGWLGAVVVEVEVRWIRLLLSSSLLRKNCADVHALRLLLSACYRKLCERLRYSFSWASLSLLLPAPMLLSGRSCRWWRCCLSWIAAVFSLLQTGFGCLALLLLLLFFVCFDKIQILFSYVYCRVVVAVVIAVLPVWWYVAPVTWDSGRFCATVLCLLHLWQAVPRIVRERLLACRRLVGCRISHGGFVSPVCCH